MSRTDVNATRQRFLEDQQATLRTPSAVLGTAALFAVLAVLPLIPGARTVVGVPVVASALWAGTYVGLSLVGFALHRRHGTRSRSFWVVSAIETGVFMVGAVGLGGISGSVASPWIVLVMLGLVWLPSNCALIDRANNVVAAATPIAGVLAYASHGLGPAVTIAVVLGLGAVGYFLIGSTVERFLSEQAEREALQRRVATLERELERARIARDLHDSVGSALALVGTYGSLIERAADDPAQLRRVSETLRDASREGLDELRGLLDALAPTDPTLEGLATSLRALAARFGHTLDATFELAGPPAIEVDARVRLAVIRVFQEALHNAIRHGGARRVEASITVRDDRLVLEVADHGAGFDRARAAAGRGLANMHARATELGGAFEVDSAPGSGTRLRFAVPARPAI